MTTVSAPTFFDPRTITEDQLPVIILCSDQVGLVAGLIKWWTGSKKSAINRNHAMIMRRIGWASTQNNVFKEVKLSTYLIPSQFLTFFQPIDLSAEEKNLILDNIQKDLKAPWWTRMYDGIGIVGQFIKAPFVNAPHFYYCSERVAKYLRMIPRYAKWLPAHINPTELETLLREHQESFRYLGYWLQI